jgi:hypothetical protein
LEHFSPEGYRHFIRSLFNVIFAEVWFNDETNADQHIRRHTSCILTIDTMTQRFLANLTKPDTESHTAMMATGVDNSAVVRTIQTTMTNVFISSTALYGNITKIISTSSSSTMLLINSLSITIAVIGFSANLMMWSVMV